MWYVVGLGWFSIGAICGIIGTLMFGKHMYEKEKREEEER